MGRRFTEAPCRMTLLGARGADGAARASVGQSDATSPRGRVRACRETVNCPPVIKGSP